MEAPFLQMFLFGTLVCAAVTDLRWARVPNWLTGIAMATAIAGHTTLHGQEGFLFSVEGLGLGLALFFPFYLLGAFGGGDVKLLAAVGSFVGPVEIISVASITVLVGGLYAASLMVTYWGFHASLRRIITIFRTIVLTRKLSAGLAHVSSQPKLRYALAIGLGTVISFLWEDLFWVL